jgi:hypothetical protein
MNDQPEALRLAELWADYLPAYNYKQVAADTAAELRRLHEENNRLGQINFAHEIKLSVRGYEIQIADLKAQRDELLEALREIATHTRRSTLDPTDIVPTAGAILARAAIAKAEGKE